MTSPLFEEKVSHGKSHKVSHTLHSVPLCFAVRDFVQHLQCLSMSESP